jgi:hypothetical protein
MKAKKLSHSNAPARTVEHRYLHIAGAFAAGGVFNRVGQDIVIDVPIPTVASVTLPMVGGLSTAAAKKSLLDCSNVKFDKMPKAALAKLRQTQLLAVDSATTICRSINKGSDEAYRSSASVDTKGVKIDGGFSLKRALLNLQSEHRRGEKYPRITFGPTEITGLKLGKYNVTVELDLETFNNFPTLELLEPALLQSDKRMSAGVSKSFLRGTDGSLYRNSSAYTVGSIVKSITGVPDGWVEDDGYTINWPGFGKIILGEIIVGAYLRRVTLVRLKHSDIEISGGCDGGSTWPADV